MFDTSTVAPDITEANFQRWANYFYVEIALWIIEDSWDLRKDWETKIKPQFRTFFLTQEEVREHAWITSFNEDARANEKRIVEVDRWHRQAEKMLHEKVNTHLGYTERGISKVLCNLWEKFAAIMASFSGKWEGLENTYAGEDFLQHTDNTAVLARPGNNKPKGYFGWDDSLLK